MIRIVGCGPLLLHIMMMLVAGLLAWEVVRPASFWEVLGFLLVWGLFEAVGGVLLTYVLRLIHRGRW